MTGSSHNMRSFMNTEMLEVMDTCQEIVNRLVVDEKLVEVSNEAD